MSTETPLPWWAQRLIDLRRARAWAAADLACELKKLRDGLPSVRSLTHMIQMDWETGKHRPGPRYRLLLAVVFGTDEQEIFGNPDLCELLPQYAGKSGSGSAALADVQKPAWGSTPKEVAKVAAGLWRTNIEHQDTMASGWTADALSEPLGRWLLDPADQSVSGCGRRQVGRADVDAVWSMCAAFADADHRLGGGHARRSLICYADDVVTPLLAGRYTDQIGWQLFAGVARLCDIAGFMCFDSGDQGRGQRYFVTALRMAKASGDQALGAHILADMSMQAEHQRHAHEAVALADAGVAAAAKSACASALARCHAVRARALAQQGDSAGSGHALYEAERALDRSGRGSEPLWMTFFTAQQLAAEAMYAAAQMHRADLVRRHAASALAADEGMQRRQVLATATLAASYLPAESAIAADAEADVGQACEVLRGVLPVVGSLTSTRALDLVGAVRSRLTSYPRVAAVQELERDLDLCMAGTGP